METLDRLFPQQPAPQSPCTAVSSVADDPMGVFVTNFSFSPIDVKIVISCMSGAKVAGV